MFYPNGEKMEHISNVSSNMKRCKEKSTEILLISFELHIKAEHDFIFIHCYYYYDFNFIQTLSHMFSYKYLGKVHLIFRLRKLQNNKGNRSSVSAAPEIGRYLGEGTFYPLKFNDYCSSGCKKTEKACRCRISAVLLIKQE